MTDPRADDPAALVEWERRVDVDKIRERSSWPDVLILCEYVDFLRAALRAAREPAWLALTQYQHHWPGCDSMAPGPDGELPEDCACGLRGKTKAAFATIAQDPPR